MTSASTNMFIIHVDDKIFTLMRKTIESYPNTLLARAIKQIGTSFEHQYVRVCGSDIYVDRDPESFKYVIDRLRNYEINLDSITDEYFKKKVIDDLDYFDLLCAFDGNNDDGDDIKICDIDSALSLQTGEQTGEPTGEPTGEQKPNQELDPTPTPTPTEIKNVMGLLLNGIDDNISNPFEIMNKLSNDVNLSNLIKKSTTHDKESSSNSLEFTDDDDYELV
jgi:hypothetical protein